MPTRWGADSRDYFERCNDEILVGVQIETREAIDELEEIAALPGLDLLLVGPADLSAAFGHFLDLRHDDVEALVARVVETARRHGKAAGYYCNTGKEARSRAEQGFQVTNVASDVGALLGGLRRQLRDARSAD